MLLTNDGLKEKIGYLVNFKLKNDVWCEYELENGLVLRIKTVTQIAEIEGEKDEFGNPGYNIQAQPVMTVVPNLISLIIETKFVKDISAYLHNGDNYEQKRSYGNHY